MSSVSEVGKSISEFKENPLTKKILEKLGVFTEHMTYGHLLSISLIIIDALEITAAEKKLLTDLYLNGPIPNTKVFMTDSLYRLMSSGYLVGIVFKPNDMGIACSSTGNQLIQVLNVLGVNRIPQRYASEIITFISVIKKLTTYPNGKKPNGHEKTTQY